MEYRSFTSILFTLIVFIGVVSSLQVAYGQVMGSSNYQIQSDSLNVGGGYSTSTNYRQESTVGEIGTGMGTSETYQLRAGYQQMQEVYIAISGATTTVLTPAIGGISGGVSNGSTTVTVITDSPSGYSLSIRSELSPALWSGSNTIADYAPAGFDPDFTFLTDTAEAHLAYSPEGIDISSRYRDNGAVCNSGAGDTALACWDGLATTPRVIAEGVDSNHPGGATTTIRFRVGVGANAQPAPGVYLATTTVTALPL